MHPGPMNRGVEIDDAVASSANSLVAAPSTKWRRRSDGGAVPVAWQAGESSTPMAVSRVWSATRDSSRVGRDSVAEERQARIVLRGGTVLDASGERRADVLVASGTIVEVAPEIAPPAVRPCSMPRVVSSCRGLSTLHLRIFVNPRESERKPSRAVLVQQPSGVTARSWRCRTRSRRSTRRRSFGTCANSPGRPWSRYAVGAITILDGAARSWQRSARWPRSACTCSPTTAEASSTRASCDGPLEEVRHWNLGVRPRRDTARTKNWRPVGRCTKGAWSSRLGIAGQPGLAEEAMLARDLALVRLTGAPMHFLHLSTKGSVALLADAKREGLPVTAEITPHHLALTDAAVAGYDAVFKVNPPLRETSDVAALRAAVRDGTIDAIATDHAPHPPERKDEPFGEGACLGMIGLETALAVSFGALCLAPEPSIGLGELFALFTEKPARIAGLSDHGGPVAAGRPAHLCVFDPAQRWTVPGSMKGASRSRNSPFSGWSLTGKVRHTVVRGEVVVEGGILTR